MPLGRSGQLTSYLKFHAPSRVSIDEKSTQREGQTVYVTRGCMNFYVGNRDREYWVHIPHGWCLTGAVVPRLFRNWIKPDSLQGKAAIVHHYLRTTGRVRIAKVRMRVDCYEANMVFLEAMKVANVGFFKRWILFIVAFSTHENSNGDKEEAKRAFSS